MASKKFQFKKAEEQPTVLASGETYQPHEVKDGKAALAAVLHLMMAHTADVFHGIVDAISDHYKIPKDEMMEVVMAHPAYTEIIANPVLTDLGYFAQAPAPAPTTESPKPKKKFVVKKAAVAAE
jgi:hypothetical protein